MVTFEVFVKDPMKYVNDITTRQLTTFLRKLAVLYYNTSKSPVSDKIFDELKDILMERDPNNSFLDEVGAPIEGGKVKLPFPMGSLNKVKPDNKEFDKWIQIYFGPYVLSDKMDGISALIHKTLTEIHMYTRGNGIFGQDISHLIPYLKIDPSKIPNNTAVRGELIISKNNFKKIADKMENARNASSGIVNSKVVDKNMVKYLQFITYSVVHPTHKQTKQFELLEEWGFQTAPYKIVKKISVDSLKEYFKERREINDFDIDGIVVIDDGNAYNVAVGNPKYGFAFKSIMDDQIAVATVEDVEWEISRYGYIKPTIRITPIKLVGVTITYATAHNAKFIYDNKIGVGSKIKILRSGDVIPKIQEVLQPATNGKPKMPDIAYEWNETGVDIIVKNETDDSKMITTIKQIVNFMETLDVKFINEGIVKKLVENGFTTIQKLLKTKRSNIENIIGEKMTEKIMTNLEHALKNTQLHILMTASNCFGRGLGEKKLNVITNAYPTIMKKQWTKEKLQTKLALLNGFQEKTIDKFIDGFEKFKKFFNKLSEIIDLKYLVEPDTIDQGTLFTGQKIAMTGFRDDTIEIFITKNGGNITGTVSKNTGLLIHADNPKPSSKLEKADELGIKMMSQSEFMKKYKLK